MNNGNSKRNKTQSNIVPFSAKVEIDVPQTCSLILRTTECALSEIYEVNEDGTAMYRPAAGAEAFRSAMARYAHVSRITSL